MHSETLEETIESGPLCITDLFQNKISPKKNDFSPEKNTSQKKQKKLPFFYATFQCGRYNVFKKKKILTTKSWKTHPKKLLIIGPDPFFSLQPRLPKTAQKFIPVL